MVNSSCIQAFLINIRALRTWTQLFINTNKLISICPSIIIEIFLLLLFLFHFYLGRQPCPWPGNGKRKGEKEEMGDETRGGER